MASDRAEATARRAGGPLAEFRAAVAFLTRVQPGAAADLERTGAAAFAVVGALIGGVGAIPVLVLGPRLPLPAAAVALAVIAVLTGGLHLDGLGDTADALAAPTRDAAERARTDPRVGPAGVAAIVLDLLLGAALLAAITAADPVLAVAALVAAGTGSRASAPIAAGVARWRQSQRQTGLGGWFATRIRGADVVVVLATAVVIIAGATIVSGATALWPGTVVGVAVAAALAAAAVVCRGQLDGDGYGAIVEITFLGILAGIAVLIP